jgi:hypothetical protein
MSASRLEDVVELLGLASERRGQSFESLHEPRQNPQGA